MVSLSFRGSAFQRFRDVFFERFFGERGPLDGFLRSEAKKDENETKTGLTLASILQKPNILARRRIVKIKLTKRECYLIIEGLILLHDDVRNGIGYDMETEVNTLIDRIENANKNKGA